MELCTLYCAVGVSVDETVVEGDKVCSRFSLTADTSDVLCFRKRDIKPFKPGPAEAGGEATDGGDIFGRANSFAVLGTSLELEKASGDRGWNVIVCEDGGVLANSTGGCEGSRLAV